MNIDEVLLNIEGGGNCHPFFYNLEYVLITGKNYIGNDLKANGDITFKTINPELNKENDWVLIEATEVEIQEAVEKAQSAFQSYRQISDEERATFLRTIATKIEELGPELIQVYIAESGLTEARAKVELKRTLFQLRSFADHICTDDWRRTSIDLGENDRKPTPKPDLRKTHIPLGPVVVFGSSNFPFAYSTAGGDTASALAAGCPVLVKSHPMHAGTGELVASAIIEAVKECKMPDGVFSNLNSSGIEVGKFLVQSKGVKAVGFTGSIQGGRAIFDLANKRPEPIPVFAEMGSVNPVIISELSLTTEKDKWVNQYSSSITNGSGQFCTNPGLILGIGSDELDSFSQSLAEEMDKLASTCMLHPQIKSKYDKAKAVVEDSPVTEKISQGNRHLKDNYAEQTIMRVKGKDFLANTQLHHEVFGPFSIVVSCKNLDELNLILEELGGQLTGTIIMKEVEFDLFKPTLEILKQKAGRIIFNGVPTGVEVCASMNHGGPFPATTDSRFTAVGVDAIYRWLRPICFQNFPDTLLPSELLNK